MTSTSDLPMLLNCGDPGGSQSGRKFLSRNSRQRLDLWAYSGDILSGTRVGTYAVIIHDQPHSFVDARRTQLGLELAQETEEHLCVGGVLD